MPQSQNENEIKGTESLSGEKSHHLPSHQNPNVKCANVLQLETSSKPN